MAWPVAEPCRVVLASASASRLGLLRAAGITAVVRPPQVDEDALLAAALQSNPAASVAALTGRLAEAKLHDARHRHGLANLPGKHVLIAADSLFTCRGQIMGKPANPEQARQRWRMMRGRTGVLMTAHAVAATGVADVDPTEVRVRAVASEVDIADISDDEIEAYLATSEPYSAAGAFTLEGRAAGFITAVRGSVSNVQGLSLPDLRELLSGLGIEWPTLWSTPTHQANGSGEEP